MYPIEDARKPHIQGIHLERADGAYVWADHRGYRLTSPMTVEELAQDLHAQGYTCLADALPLLHGAGMSKLELAELDRCYREHSYE